MERGFNMANIFANGEKLLTESDLPPQWNLLTGTSQDFKTVTIPKNSYFPGKYEFLNNFDFPVVFSAYVINKSNQDLVFNMDHGSGNEDTVSSIIKANSQGRYTVAGAGTSGVYLKTANQVAVSSDTSVQIKEEKLERGSKATQWMPAISDLMLKNQNGGVRQPANPLVSMLYVPSFEMEVA